LNDKDFFHIWTGNDWVCRWAGLKKIPKFSHQLAATLSNTGQSGVRYLFIIQNGHFPSWVEVNHPQILFPQSCLGPIQSTALGCNQSIKATCLRSQLGLMISKTGSVCLWMGILSIKGEKAAMSNHSLPQLLRVVFADIELIQQTV
jgi:hypothetical protein